MNALDSLGYSYALGQSITLPLMEWDDLAAGDTAPREAEFTLLNLLGGLDMPTSGTVLLEGQDLYACDEAALAAIRRRRMGFVFQDFQLLAE